MASRAIRKDSQKEDDRWTELLSDKKELRKECKELRKENKEILALSVQNERLKIRAEFSILGDGLLTVGSIGFGFLGVYGQDIFSDHVLFAICSGVALAAAGIGFVIKLFSWWRQIIAK